MCDRATIRVFCGDGAEVALARLWGAVDRHSDRTGTRWQLDIQKGVKRKLRPARSIMALNSRSILALESASIW
jgi:hypothetical protein